MFSSNAVKNPLYPLAAFALAWCLAAPAQAATQSLTLTGIVGNGFSSSQVIGATRFDQFILSLDGVTPFSLANLDHVAASITLDQALTVPASVDRTSLGLILQGTGFVGDPVETANAAFQFSLNGGPLSSAVVASTGASTTNQVAGAIVILPPFNVALTFDTMTADYGVTALSAPVNITNAYLTYTLFSPAVPEPAAQGLMLLGLAALGAMAARRRGRNTVG